MVRKFAIKEIQDHKFLLILIPEYHQSPTGLFIASPHFLDYFLYDQQIFRNLTVFKKKEVGVAPRHCSLLNPFMIRFALK